MEASIEVEPLVASAPVSAAASPAPTLAKAPAAAVTFDILANVAMRGDVKAREGEWLAGPASPAPIEGVTAGSSDRERLSVEIQVLVAGAAKWSPWMAAGQYAGTRGRGLPLAGVRLRLAGREANEAVIAAEALFLGALVQSKSGSQIEFVSSTGRDPLVGFKLSVRRTEKPQGARPSENGAAEFGSRVRVFRSSAA